VARLGYAATIATPGPRDRFGHLKGADFLHAYVLGTIALERSSAPQIRVRLVGTNLGGAIPGLSLAQVVGSRCPSVDELARGHNSSLFPDLWEMADIAGDEVMGLRGLGAFEKFIIVRVACR